MKTIISSPQAPAAVGPYSPAVMSGDFLFLSGQIPLDISGQIVGTNVTEQTEQVMRNAHALLQVAGCDWRHVLKTTVFLTDMGQFSAMNEVYAKYFTSEPPARSTIQVSALPKGAQVEIEFVVRKF